nr:hypothetical protein [Tanacetum cinerariifolium]
MHAQLEDIKELLRKLLEDLQIINEELEEYINSLSWNRPAFYDDDDEYFIQYKEYLKNSSNEIVPVLPTEDLDNSLTLGDEHRSTILKTKFDELIKSSVENLVPIPIFSDFNDDCTSSDDDYFEDIDYVEASPLDSELVSLKEVQDDIPREKLLNINLLIAKIESLIDNSTLDCVLKSPSTFSIPIKDSESFFEKPDTSLSYSNNSLPEFETFSDHTEETSYGSTTTHADNSLPEYDSFPFEIEPDQGELTSVVIEDILEELRVYDCLDFKDSRARGFAYRPLDLQSFASLSLGNLISNSCRRTLTITLNRLERSSHTKGYTSETNENTTNPQQVLPTPQASHTLSTIKLPILKKGEYDIWAMKIEHYLEHTDYLIWEVIQKGNGHVRVSTYTNGQIKVLPPKTAEEILAKGRERKARTTLLITIPEDRLAKFYKMTDAKEMFQSLLSQLETHGASVFTKDDNQKFFRSLPSSWSQVSLIMRTKPGVDTLSFDDLYNNLRIFESNVKGSTGSSSSIQNVEFISSDNTSSTNEVNTAYGVSTSSGHNSKKEDHEDLEQVDEFDLEEIDLKWHVTMISTRLKRSKGNQDSRRRDARNTRYKTKDNGKRPAKQDEHKAMVTIDGESIEWTGHAEDKTEDYALMAFNSSNSGSDTKEKRMAKQVELNKQKGTSTGPRENRPVWKNVHRLNHQNKFIPTAVLTRNGRFPINAARQNFSSQAASARNARKVNTTRPKVNEIKPKHNVYKSHSPIKRPFNKTTARKANFAQHKVNTARDKSLVMLRANGKLLLRPQQDNPHPTLKGKGIIDSGCSRHMTGNKAYLVDYQDFHGGPVAFGGKFEENSDEGFLVGYSLSSKAFKSSKAKNGDKKLNEDIDSKTNEKPLDQEDQAFLEELA